MKRPQPQEFGITPAHYELYTRKHLRGFSWLAYAIALALVVLTVFFTAALVAFAATRDVPAALKWGATANFSGWLFVAIAAYFIYGRVKPELVWHKRQQLMDSPIADRLLQYQAARKKYLEVERAAYRRAKGETRQSKRHAAYWMGLSGLQFERELETLYRGIGYQVSLTPTSAGRLQSYDFCLRDSDPSFPLKRESRVALLTES